MSDPLSSAVTGVLWPYLKSVGFKKSGSRKFAREKAGVIQQLWVDANGVAKSKSTRIVLCCTFPFASPTGYMDPHGFIILRGKHFDMSTDTTAQASMAEVVAALQRSELAALDQIANAEHMLNSLKPMTNRNWHAMYSELFERWSNGDADLQEAAAETRRALKL